LRIHDDGYLHEQGRADLWRDPQLQLALDWWEATLPNAAWARPLVSGGAAGDAGFLRARDFLQRSRQARQEETARARKRRLTVQIAGGLVMAVMGALILWGAINIQKIKAEHQLAVARALA
jgi:hypothetical protein